MTPDRLSLTDDEVNEIQIRWYTTAKPEEKLAAFNALAKRPGSPAAQWREILELANHFAGAMWQTMERAPKDDSEHKYILGGWYDHGFHVDQCYWDKDEKKWLCNTSDSGGWADYWKPWTEPKC